MERDPDKLKLLEKWKAILQSRHTVAAFEDGSSLAIQVATDLGRTIQDLEEVAEARAKARSTGKTWGSRRSSRHRLVVLVYAGDAVPVIRYAQERLSQAGFVVVFDRLLTDTDAWMQETESVLAEADFLVFFITPGSAANIWTKRDLQVALHRQLSGEHSPVILPVLLQHAEVPPLLRQFSWLDLSNRNIEEGVGELVEGISRQAASHRE